MFEWVTVPSNVCADDKERHITGYGVVAFSVTHMASRWLLLVGRYDRMWIHTGSFHATRADAEQAAERIAHRWEDKERDRIRRSMRSAETEDQFNVLYDRLYGNDV